MKLLDIARAAVGLSHAGLVARGLAEEQYLAPLIGSLVRESVHADRWIELYRGDWAGDLGRIYEAASL